MQTHPREFAVQVAIKRRFAIRLVILTAVVVCTGDQLAAENVPGEDLRNPPERRAECGELCTQLTVAYADHMIGSQSVHLRNYENLLTGPTLRVRPGDLLRILLRNDLPKDKNDAMHGVQGGQNKNPMPPHGFNITNLHSHGLHVSPAGNSDNVFLEIGPGQRFPYEIKVPRDHHPGTFWYHAHKHGSVALQLASGMAGALIVEGGLDTVPAIYRARERIMVFQQIAYDKNGEVEGDFYPLGRGGPTTINGRLLPEIHMRPCEVQRWRLIHAGISSDLKLVLEGHQFNEIACDGIARGCMKTCDNIHLYPGYRSDVLVKASLTPGRYLLKDAPVPAEEAIGQRARTNFTPLATLVISGRPLPMNLPKQQELEPLAPFKPITHVKGSVEIAFDFKANTGTVNGTVFDPNGSNILHLKLGEVQEWHVKSVHEVHPFHVHVNPFEVITRDSDNKIIDRLWRDTMVVLAHKDIYLRTRYDRYIGRSVLHCHNLLHEDLGMMMAIDIEP